MANDWPPKETVYMPFFRRFADEDKIEQQETSRLYSNACAVPLPDPLETIERTAAYIRPCSLRPLLVETIEKIVRGEGWIFAPIYYDFNRLNIKELTDAKAFMRRRQYFGANSEQILQLLHEALVRVFCEYRDHLPEAQAPSPFTIPLMYAVPVGNFFDGTFETLKNDQYIDRSLFLLLLDRMYRNMCAESDVEPYAETKRKLIRPSENKIAPSVVVDRYFSGTPFQELFKTPVPLKFTTETRMSHMHVVGGTGAGKTTLLKQLILHDLQSKNPPGLVIVDSQGDLIRTISRLDDFDPDHGRLRDRLILISPKDIKHPPALNIFDINKDRLGTYDDVTREQVVAGVIQTFDYLFAGLLGADLTAKQGVFFKYVARLMLALPETMGRNATILDMMNLMEDHAPYQKAIESLPPLQRNFFERDFVGRGGKKSNFEQTKEQIRYRLAAILENPTIARLFTSEEQRLDLFTELNRGSIILVDTAKDFLKGSSSHFGRIFISLVLQAVQERAALPEDDREPAFLIVDEAAEYFDDNIDDLLTETRKYKLGCVFAHQYLHQASSSLRASLAANTTIKFAAGLSNADAREMASDMRTTPDFIMDQPKLHFAAHIRNVTPTAVSIPLKVGEMERQRKLSDAQYEKLIARNRTRVSIPTVLAEPLSSVDPELPDDTSRKWEE